MRRTRWVVSRAIGLLVLVAIGAGCATPETPLPPPMAMKPGDFKRLAGLWFGTAYVEEAAPVNIQAVVYEGISRAGLRGTPMRMRASHNAPAKRGA